MVIEPEKTKTEILLSMWIMLIGAFIIIVCQLLNYMVEIPAFVFAVVVYLFFVIFLFMQYPLTKRFKNWIKTIRQ